MPLLLAAMALGAIVSLLAVRLSQALSQSTAENSRAVLQLAMDNLSLKATEAARTSQLLKLTETVQKLDLTVGQLYLASAANPIPRRTILEKPAQVGEVTAGNLRRVPVLIPEPPPLPDGLVEPNTPAPNAAAETRARAFAVPT